MTGRGPAIRRLDDIMAVGRLSPGDPILEVGCGAGIAAEDLAAKGLDSTFWPVTLAAT